MDAFIATILPWAGQYPPRGWMFCMGQELAINQYQAVYAVIGTQYGGNGTTTFKLPDLRGRFPIGSGTNPTTNTNWITGTKYDTNMKAYIGINNIPPHAHAISNKVTGPDNGTPMALSLDIGIPVNTDTSNSTPTNAPTNNNCTLAVAKTAPPQNMMVNMYTTNLPSSNATLKPFTVSKNVNIPTPAITVESTCGTTGNGQAVDVQPPTLCINFIICLEGIFPSRD